ncbi:PQQ-dependent sugar dehydrogenase [Luteolibacter ambystomatis]|uniref:PQQ-dependent sugar dehydrogenase n=1 Tax=Luteolibacter ambystomatis TaxID=2824561 RepID=A0A975J2I4_9BACT|nr:PQQ-dependent sugar dehydrogenase [Luteolibacter ambystomatis]QUE52776.1 PQQ-dependent sugar dehydrogenase [Luteolibacter ambystomatis]
MPSTRAIVSLLLAGGACLSCVRATAVDDTAVVQYGQKVLIPVLANDSGYRKPATVSIVTPPSHGSVTVDSAGRILYTHTTGTPATDTFRYAVKRTATLTYQAKVTVTLSGALRIENPALTMPAEPPPTDYSLVNAFGSVVFRNPVCMASPPTDKKRLFVCEKTGVIKVIPDVTAKAPASKVFLDLNAALPAGEKLETTNEMGLIGLAFHPSYATNRYFYIFYSVKVGDVFYERLARFTAKATDPNAADPATQYILINQLDRANEHNAGCLHFGPDRYLYFSAGDEGNQNDIYNNSQKITGSYFSGIFRIDVDKKPGNLPPNPHPALPLDKGAARFSVPVDNPWVHTSLGGSWDGRFAGEEIPNLSTVRTEFWAIGLRNPWRFSFDPPTGDLWCGDVGGAVMEEVDLITKGANYGWAFREATIDGPKIGQWPQGVLLTAPVYAYSHNNASSAIVGGVVYRGAKIASLYGKYVFGDYATGGIFTLERNGGDPPIVKRISGDYLLSAFGTDPSNGDILLANLATGRLHRLTATTGTSNFPQTLSETKLFADLGTMSPAPGLLPYDVNLSFWSDHAIKRRWFTIPKGTTIGWSQDNPWSFPAGTFWVKHFEMEMTRGRPDTRKRLETRVLVRNGTGIYGVSYRWNDAGTEATLVPDEGVDFDLNVIENNTPRVQRWHIPSRSECMNCHSVNGGFALGFDTRQLNLDGAIHDFTGNQLALLQNGGYFTGTLPSPNMLPRHLRPDETAFPLEGRVRSYLAVNCSYCHRNNAIPTANWDGRAALPLDETGLINGQPFNAGTDALNKLIVPGDTGHSVLFKHLTAGDGFSRMPPVASNELDQASIALVSNWITQDLPIRQNYASWRLASFGSSTSPRGEAGADPDKDGQNNREEYLTGTPPTDPNAKPVPALKITGHRASLSFNLPPARSFQVETSPDLKTWHPWNIPGNGGLPAKGGTSTLDGPIAPGDRHFFRVIIREN